MPFASREQAREYHREYQREWRRRHPGYGAEKQRAYRGGGSFRWLDVRANRVERTIAKLKQSLACASRKRERLERLRARHTCFGCGKFASGMIERAVVVPGGRDGTRLVPYCGHC
jgi:hypothetical protein